jgi:hypothetical protein
MRPVPRSRSVGVLPLLVLLATACTFPGPLGDPGVIGAQSQP